MDIVTVLVTLMVTEMVFMTLMMIEGNTNAVLGSTCSLPKSRSRCFWDLETVKWRGP